MNLTFVANCAMPAFDHCFGEYWAADHLKVGLRAVLVRLVHAHNEAGFQHLDLQMRKPHRELQTLLHLKLEFRNDPLSKGCFNKIMSTAKVIPIPRCNRGTVAIIAV